MKGSVFHLQRRREAHRARFFRLQLEHTERQRNQRARSFEAEFRAIISGNDLSLATAPANLANNGVQQEARALQRKRARERVREFLVTAADAESAIALDSVVGAPIGYQ